MHYDLLATGSTRAETNTIDEPKRISRVDWGIMIRKFVFLYFLGLTFFCQPAFAYWTDDYVVGDSYSGLLDIGPLGARKHVALPPSEGDWILVSMNEVSAQFRTPRSSFESVKMGQLVFAEVIEGKVVAVLEAKASQTANDVIWPDMCLASENFLFRDNFPEVRRPTEKCLVLETVTSSALTSLPKGPIVNFSLKPNSNLIRATATIQGIEGFLQLKITTISDGETNQNTLEKAYNQWAQKFAGLLEPSLTHSADHQFKKLTGIPRQLADGKIVEYVEAKGKIGDVSHEQILRSIEKLKEFKDKGILSEDEFKAKKDELLKRL